MLSSTLYFQPPIPSFPLPLISLMHTRARKLRCTCAHTLTCVPMPMHTHARFFLSDESCQRSQGLKFVDPFVTCSLAAKVLEQQSQSGGLQARVRVQRREGTHNTEAPGCGDGWKRPKDVQEDIEKKEAWSPHRSQ